MKIHLLDMGTVPYGDCIVITQGRKSILIDGGHQGDYNSILRQFARIFQHEGPYTFDLLIVTHCHDDHIGCLHNLSGNGDIVVKKALLADPVYRWGAGGGLDTESREPFIDALFEEDRSELDDAEIEQFLFDSEQLPVRYDRMIKSLKKAGTVVKMFRGADKDNYTLLEKEFKSFGLKILGPTNKQLTITQSSLLDSAAEVSRIIEKMPETDAIQTEVDLYRRIFQAPLMDNNLLLDAKKNKGAINNHSIVIKVAEAGWSALLAGDMQFSDPEVSGLEAEMKTLLKVVNKAGPYTFIKTAHHTSYNGLNEELLDQWLSDGTTLFAHSGGKKDDKHPEKTVLSMLKERSDQFEFARTDRNGIITVGKDPDGNIVMDIEKGKKNVFTANPKPARNDGDPIEKPVAVPVPVPVPVASPAQQKGVAHTSQLSSGNMQVTVTATFSLGAGPVTITVDSEKKKSDVGFQSTADPSGKESRFSNLLFVTCMAALAKKYDTSMISKLKSRLDQMPGISVVDISHTNDCLQAARTVHNSINSSTKGVVLVGGYDIIPSLQFNLLSEEMREAVRQEIRSKGHREDPDNFIVWSDDAYVDTEGDFLPEYPVSRIPDGKGVEQILAALSAAPFTVSGRFGIHNFRRPFAVDIFEKVPYTISSKLEASELFKSLGQEEVLAKGAVYLMLHGSDRDATRFTGETKLSSTRYIDAFEIINVPKSCSGTVVFSGCCWGGLIVQPIAQFVDPGIPLRHRHHEDSIAMAYLMAGANAFVGCTGAHYSPARPGDNFFGKPMHDAFWTELKKGVSPAQALFRAKKQYALNIPHGLEDSALTTAVEFKSMHQFTCLGLGW